MCQFRLYLHSIAYSIMQRLREALAGTALVTARFSTLMLRLLKIGGRLEQTTRRLRFHLPAAYPLRDLFGLLLAQLRGAPG